MKSYHLGKSLPEVYFSDLQAQCIAHFSLGRSIDQISKTLKLSPRTIEALLIDLQKRLHCDSKTDLLKKVKKSHFMNYAAALVSPTNSS